MPTKKEPKKIKIRTVRAPKAAAVDKPVAEEEKFQIMSERRILDEKLLKSSSDESMGTTIGLIVLVGLLLGGGVLAYLLYTKSAVEPLPDRNIVIPETSTPAPETAPQPTTPTSTAPETHVVVQEVQIEDTPTGFLNVRSGPGTNFAKIAKVKPGETYQLISEDASNGGWYQIRLDASRTGWVIKEYAKIK